MERGLGGGGCGQVAINGQRGTPLDQPLIEVGGVKSPARRDAGERPRTLNRRSREAYNAYMREYMRKRRAG